MKKYIYIITTFCFTKEGKLKRPRTVGMIKKFKEAEKIIKYNICDICELNYYNVALIEKVPLIMYPDMDKIKKWWYAIEMKDRKDYDYKYLGELDFPPFDETSYFYKKTE